MKYGCTTLERLFGKIKLKGRLKIFQTTFVFSMRQFIAYQDKLQMGYWEICFEIYRQTVFCFGKDTLKETMAACCLSAEPKAEN